MRRVAVSALVLVVVALVGPRAGAQQSAPPSSLASCDATTLDADSYRLTTEAQAMNVLRPREPWWEPYGLWKEPREIGDVNQGALRLAEKAKELDDRNLMAHGYLARQYVVMAVDARKAEAEWERVLGNGGAIVWTATLYDVDPRGFFVLAFDRRGIRVFRFGQVAGELRTHFGVPDFPGPERTDFWRALGGCLPPGAVVDAEIPWSSVREIRTTRWTLRLLLDREVTITSDRGRHRTDDRVELNLHGQTGDVDFRFGMTPFGRGPFNARPTGLDPEAYQVRVRQMLVKMFELEDRLGTTRH